MQNFGVIRTTYIINKLFDCINTLADVQYMTLNDLIHYKLVWESMALKMLTPKWETIKYVWVDIDNCLPLIVNVVTYHDFYSGFDLIRFTLTHTFLMTIINQNEWQRSTLKPTLYLLINNSSIPSGISELQIMNDAFWIRYIWHCFGNLFAYSKLHLMVSKIKFTILNYTWHFLSNIWKRCM